MSKGITHVIYGENCIAARQFIAEHEKFLENKNAKIEYVLYKKLEGQEIVSSFFGKSEQVSVIALRGNVRLITNQPFISGGFFADSDTGSCVLDKNTAFQLFKTAELSGGKIIWNEKEYIVRGVLDTKENVCFLNEPNDNSMFQFINCEFVDWKEEEQFKGMQPRDIINELSLRCVGVEPKLIVGESEYAGLLKGISKVPVYLLFLWTVYCITKRNIWRTHWKDRWKRKIMVLFLCIAYLVVFWNIGDMSVKIRPDMVPARWSNFEFFEEKWSSFIKELGQLYNTNTILDVLELKKGILMCIGLSGISYVLLISSLGFLWAEEKVSVVSDLKELYIGCGIMVGASLILYRFGIGSFVRFYTFFLPLCYLFKIICDFCDFIERNVKKIEENCENINQNEK